MIRVIASQGLPYTEFGRKYPDLKPTMTLTRRICKVLCKGDLANMKKGPEMILADNTSITTIHLQGEAVAVVKHLTKPESALA